MGNASTQDFQNFSVTINDELVDWGFGNDFAFQIFAKRQDFQEPAAKTFDSTKNVKLPRTQTNERVLGFCSEDATENNFATGAGGVSNIPFYFVPTHTQFFSNVANSPFHLKAYNRGVLLFEGVFVVQEVDEDSFSGFIVASKYDWSTQLGDRSMRLIQMPATPFVGGTTVLANMADQATEYYANRYAHNRKWDFTFALTSFGRFFTPLWGADGVTVPGRTDILDVSEYPPSFGKDFVPQLSFRDFTPLFYVTSLIGHIMNQIGWSAAGTWFNDPQVSRLCFTSMGANDDIVYPWKYLGRAAWESNRAPSPNYPVPPVTIRKNQLGVFLWSHTPIVGTTLQCSVSSLDYNYLPPLPPPVFPATFEGYANYNFVADSFPTNCRTRVSTGHVGGFNGLSATFLETNNITEQHDVSTLSRPPLTATPFSFYSNAGKVQSPPPNPPIDPSGIGDGAHVPFSSYICPASSTYTVEVSFDVKGIFAFYWDFTNGYNFASPVWQNVSIPQSTLPFLDFLEVRVGILRCSAGTVLDASCFAQANVADEITLNLSDYASVLYNVPTPGALQPDVPFNHLFDDANLGANTTGIACEVGDQLLPYIAISMPPVPNFDAAGTSSFFAIEVCNTLCRVEEVSRRFIDSPYYPEEFEVPLNMPEMSQKEWIGAILKHFNVEMYPDYGTKTLYLEQWNNSLTSNESALDITEFVDKSIDTKKPIDQPYRTTYKYKSDSNDFVLRLQTKLNQTYTSASAAANGDQTQESMFAATSMRAYSFVRNYNNIGFTTVGTIDPTAYTLANAYNPKFNKTVFSLNGFQVAPALVVPIPTIADGEHFNSLNADYISVDASAVPATTTTLAPYAGWVRNYVPRILKVTYPLDFDQLDSVFPDCRVRVRYWDQTANPNLGVADKHTRPDSLPMCVFNESDPLHIARMATLTQINPAFPGLPWGTATYQVSDLSYSGPSGLFNKCFATMRTTFDRSFIKEVSAALRFLDFTEINTRTPVRILGDLYYINEIRGYDMINLTNTTLALVKIVT